MIVKGLMSCIVVWVEGFNTTGHSCVVYTNTYNQT